MQKRNSLLFSNSITLIWFATDIDRTLVKLAYFEPLDLRPDAIKT